MTEDIQTQLDRALVVDAENARKACDFQPRPRIVTYKAGEFLCYNGIDVPRAFIVDIKAIAGDNPVVVRGVEWANMPDYIIHDSSRIVIRLESGHTVTIPTNRHCIDILLGALRDYWKNGVSVVDHRYVDAVKVREAAR